MVDRLTEPLLPGDERASASPPSPRRQSDADGFQERTYSAGSDPPGALMSGLSAAVGALNRLPADSPVLPGVIQPRSMTITVSYWSDYDTGSQLTYTVEVAGNNTIQDLIKHSILYFQSKGGLRDVNIENYLMRAANKKLKPKTDFPAFGLDQRVAESGVSRFALCHKTLDEKAKRKLDDTEEETKLAEVPAINSSSSATLTTPSTVRRPARASLCHQQYMEALRPMKGDDDEHSGRETEEITPTERKSAYAKEAWSRVSPKVKLVLTTSVEVWSYGTFSASWVEAEIRVLAATPSVLYWTPKTGKQQQIDFVQTFTDRNESFGIKVGIVPVGEDEAGPPTDTSPEQIVTFRSSFFELTLVLPKSVFGDWKKALSALLKAYIRVEEMHSSKPTQVAKTFDRFSTYFLGDRKYRQENLGSVFDISWGEDREERRRYTDCLCIKLTCIGANAATHTEYLKFDRERRGVGKTKRELKKEMSSGKLDPANKAIFLHFMDELEILEATKSLSEIVPDSSLRPENEVFACMSQTLFTFLSRDNTFDWVGAMQCYQFDKIYSKYRSHDAVQLKRLWQARASIQFDTEGHPCAPLLRLASLYCASSQLAVSSLLQSPSGQDLLTDISRLREISEIESRGQQVPPAEDKSSCSMW